MAPGGEWRFMIELQLSSKSSQFKATVSKSIKSTAAQ